MSCTFVPPYLLQRIALRAGTRHASTPGARHCRSMTAYGPDVSRHRVKWPLHPCPPPKAGSPHRQQHRVAAGRGRSKRRRSAGW